MPGLSERLTPHTVVIVHATLGTDRYGNSYRDWANATRTSTRAFVQQRTQADAITSSGETTGDRDSQFSTWLLVLPLGVAVDGRDRVEYAGYTYEVISPPQTIAAIGGEHHIEAILRWREG